jgi:hypothetical protein
MYKPGLSKDVPKDFTLTKKAKKKLIFDPKYVDLKKGLQVERMVQKNDTDALSDCWNNS